MHKKVLLNISFLLLGNQKLKCWKVQNGVTINANYYQEYISTSNCNFRKTDDEKNRN